MSTICILKFEAWMVVLYEDYVVGFKTMKN